MTSKKRKSEDSTSQNVEGSLSKSSGAKPPLHPVVIGRDGIVHANRKRGKTNLGGSAQGDHVTAYAVVEKAIRDCVQKMSDENFSKSDKQLARDRMIKIVRTIDILDKQCAPDLAVTDLEVDVSDYKISSDEKEAIQPVLEEQKDLIVEIEGLIRAYVEQRSSSKEIAALVERLAESRDSLQNVSDSKLRECLDRLIQRKDNIISCTNSHKKLSEEEMLEKVAALVLIRFNKIPEITFVKNENYESSYSEGSDTKRATDLFITSCNNSDVDADVDVVRRVSARSNKGNLTKSSKLRSLAEAVRDTFFYPKYDDEDLVQYPDHRNDEDFIIFLAARHIFILTACYPILEEKESEISEMFFEMIGEDWQLGGGFKNRARNSLKTLKGIYEDSVKRNPVNLDGTPDRRKTYTYPDSAVGSADSKKIALSNMEEIPDLNVPANDTPVKGVILRIVSEGSSAEKLSVGKCDPKVI